MHVYYINTHTKTHWIVFDGDVASTRVGLVEKLPGEALPASIAVGTGRGQEGGHAMQLFTTQPTEMA